MALKVLKKSEIPFLKILSSMSPQTKKQKKEYIENNVVELETSSRKFYLEMLEIVRTL